MTWMFLVIGEAGILAPEDLSWLGGYVNCRVKHGDIRMCYPLV